MGNCSTKLANKNVIESAKSTNAIVLEQKELTKKLNISVDVVVAHFTPSNFPLVPIITPNTARVCKESWDQLIASVAYDDCGVPISGVTMFYNEFYSRLEQIDPNGRFEAVLNRFGQNKVAEKGAILIRIINLALSFQFDCNQGQFLLYMLGKSHSKKGIRPWMYSVFCQTLLNTIASALGTKATNYVMEAWVNLFAYMLRSMLPPSIRERCIENEVHVNTSSEFNTQQIMEEVAEMEEMRKLGNRLESKPVVNTRSSMDMTSFSTSNIVPPLLTMSSLSSMPGLNKNGSIADIQRNPSNRILGVQY